MINNKVILGLALAVGIGSTMFISAQPVSANKATTECQSCSSSSNMPDDTKRCTKDSRECTTAEKQAQEIQRSIQNSSCGCKSETCK